VKDISTLTDPIMKGHPVKPLEEAMPEFKQFLGSIRLREENEKAMAKK